MGRQIDQNKPFTEEDKAYLRSRGRGYLIPANERRFGENGDKAPAPGEEAGDFALSPFYDSATREKAVYDVGGAPLPGTTLDYNTGRLFDRDNGMTVEFTGPGHTPGAYPAGSSEPGGFVGHDIDSQGNPIDDAFDQDIVEFVVGLANKGEVQQVLADAGVEFKDDWGRQKLNDKLIINLQDRRRNGEEIVFVDEDEDGDPDAVAGDGNGDPSESSSVENEETGQAGSE